MPRGRRGRLAGALTAVVVVAACRSKPDPERRPARVAPAEDAAIADAGAPAWPELVELPRVEPLRVITLPSRPDVPRFDVGGPAVIGEIAVVGSSQLGFAAVDWRRGTLAWTRPAGARIAPPLVRGTSFVLVGACVTPPAIPAASMLLGCLRIVTAGGADEAYVAIHGPARAVEAFAAAAGPQQLWLDGDERVRWRRGDAAVTIDVLSGIAGPAAIEPPPIVVTHRGRRWEVSQHDGRIVGRSAGQPLGRRDGRTSWRTEHEVTAVLGAVYLPEQSPMIRAAAISALGGVPEVRLLDVDATGSLHGQAAWTPVPGISLLGHASSPVGDVALAVRLDKSIKRDFIAAYAANALLMYVYPLPQVLRADPVGLAIALDAERAPEAVIAFHDGDLVTVLPPLSAPPTAPGAVRGPSQNPTP